MRIQREEVWTVPPNPGDIRKCADFETFEDALRWWWWGGMIDIFLLMVMLPS